MSNKMKELSIDVPVAFQDGVGEIAESAFQDNLPEGLTAEHFDQVDTYRDQFAASVGEKLLDVAPDHFASNENDLSVADYALGGQATLSMNLSSDYQLVTKIKVDANEALLAVEQKAKEIFKENLAD